jgi:guanylate kinase
VLSKSWTTRQPRPGETDDDYTFVDREAFIERAKAGGFLEWATVLGEYYGSPTPDVPPGRDLVLEIDVHGAEQVLERTRDACGGQVHVILLLPPSRAEQEARLRRRGDSEDHVRRRLVLGDEEVEVGRRIADHVVVNDDVDRALAELTAIIASSRERPST